MEEDRIGEIGGGSSLRTWNHFGRGEVARKKEESSIKPKRPAGASFLETEIDLGAKYSLESMAKSGIEDTPELNQAILGEFNIQ